MPGSTPNYGWPYQLLTDAPNGASLGQNGFVAADASLAAEAAARASADTTLQNNLNASGLGHVDSVVYTAAGGNVTTEFMLATKTMTLLAGRRYRATLSGVGLVAGAATVGWYIGRYVAGAGPVTTSGTQFITLEFDISSSGFAQDRSRHVEFVSPGAGTYSFGISAARATGTGTFTVSANANQPNILSIDDIGT